MTHTEKQKIQLKILELQNREHKLTDWLFDNSFTHPEYGSKVNELNNLRIKIENLHKKFEQ